MQIMVVLLYVCNNIIIHLMHVCVSTSWKNYNAIEIVRTNFVWSMLRVITKQVNQRHGKILCCNINCQTWFQIFLSTFGVSVLIYSCVSVLIYAYLVKGAWHEYFEKLIMLKLAEKVSVHLKYLIHNEKTAKLCLFESNRRKMCWCSLLFKLVWWPSNISVDFSLSIWNIHTKFHHKNQKNMTKLLVPKSQCVWKKNWGMMLWIILSRHQSLAVGWMMYKVCD